jgi:hypothetical protein
MDLFRDLPAYERVRERVRDAGALKDEFWAAGGRGGAAGSQPPAGSDRGVLAALEREIEDEAKLRFPGAAVSRVRLLHTATTRKSSRGTSGSGWSPPPTGRRTGSGH